MQKLNEMCRIFNACGDLLGKKLNMKEKLGGTRSCLSDKNKGDLVRCGPFTERGKNGPLHEPSLIQSTGEIQVTKDKTTTHRNSGVLKLKTKH